MFLFDISNATTITPERSLIDKNIRNQGHLKIEFQCELVFYFSLYYDLFVGYFDHDYHKAKNICLKKGGEKDSKGRRENVS